VTGDGDRDGPGDVHPDERADQPKLDVDAVFAAIVADFGAPTPPDGGPWPAAEDLRPDEAPAAEIPLDEAPDAGLREPRQGPRHRLPEGDDVPGTHDGHDAEPRDVDDPQDRFVPPEPPPITSTDLPSRLAWVGVIGAPLFLLIAALVWRALPTLVVIAALAAFIGGFVTLVARLPRDRGDGNDDGAVV
jgi:hypothetical protein